MKKKLVLIAVVFLLLISVMTGCNNKDEQDNSLKTREYTAIGDAQKGTEIFTLDFWNSVTEVIYYESNLEYITRDKENLQKFYEVLTELEYTEIENPMLEGTVIFDIHTSDETFCLGLSRDTISFAGKCYQTSGENTARTLTYLVKTQDGLKININEESSGEYMINIADEGYSLLLPLYLNIQFSTDAEGKIIQDTKAVRYETDKNITYSNVNVYLSDEKDNTKFVWIEVSNVDFYSDDMKFLKREDFEYQLMFRFDTETFEIFNLEKNGELIEKLESEDESPTEAEVLEMRAAVTEGMSEEESERITENIKIANLTMENAYFNEELFGRLSDPEDLYWNYIDEKGDIQIGWAGEKNDIPVIVYNRFDAENFITLMEEMRDSMKSELLKADFNNMIQCMEQAKETHDVKYIEEIYHVLHDMDYFVFRYGIKDVGAYVTDKSTVSKYYDALEAYVKFN